MKRWHYFAICTATAMVFAVGAVVHFWMAAVVGWLRWIGA